MTSLSKSSENCKCLKTWLKLTQNDMGFGLGSSGLIKDVSSDPPFDDDWVEYSLGNHACGDQRGHIFAWDLDWVRW